jgi:hypothetical protein
MIPIGLGIGLGVLIRCSSRRWSIHGSLPGIRALQLAWLPSWASPSARHVYSLCSGVAASQGLGVFDVKRR